MYELLMYAFHIISSLHKTSLKSRPLVLMGHFKGKINVILRPEKLYFSGLSRAMETFSRAREKREEFSRKYQGFFLLAKCSTHVSISSLYIEP